MRYRHPVSSEELVDDLRQIYENSVHLLGFVDASGVLQSSGIYDAIEASGDAILSQLFNNMRETATQSNPLPSGGYVYYAMKANAKLQLIRGGI